MCCLYHFSLIFQIVATIFITSSFVESFSFRVSFLFNFSRHLNLFPCISPRFSQACYLINLISLQTNIRIRKHRIYVEFLDSCQISTHHVVPYFLMKSNYQRSEFWRFSLKRNLMLLPCHIPFH